MKTTNLKLKKLCGPAHGWLEVPKVFVDQVGCEISFYSYYDRMKDMAYLEEDGDMYRFIREAEKLGWGIEVQEVHIENEEPIRSLPDFCIEGFPKRTEK